MIHYIGNSFFPQGNGDRRIGTDVELDATLKENGEYIFKFRTRITMPIAPCMDWFPVVDFPCSHYAVVKSGECNEKEINEAKRLLLDYFRSDLQKFQKSLEDFAKANEETQEGKK